MFNIFQYISCVSCNISGESSDVKILLVWNPPRRYASHLVRRSWQRTLQHQLRGGMSLLSCCRWIWKATCRVSMHTWYIWHMENYGKLWKIMEMTHRHRVYEVLLKSCHSHEFNLPTCIGKTTRTDVYYERYIRVTCISSMQRWHYSSYDSEYDSRHVESHSQKLHLPKGKERDRMGNLASGDQVAEWENSGNFRWDLVVNVENHNVWLSETLLMSPDPGVERNCFIARVVVDTATSSAILSSRDFSRPRILHARAFQCTGSFGESKTRSTPWKTCYRYILGVSRCCFCLKNLKRLCLHFNPSTIEGCICFMSPGPSNWMVMSKFPAHPGVIAKSLPKHLNKNWWSTHCLVCRISQFHFPPWLELLTTQQQLLTCQFRYSKNSSCCAFHAAFQTHLLQIGCDAVLRSSSHLPLPLPNKPRNGPEWIHKTYTTWKGSMVAIPILEFELFL